MGKKEIKLHMGFMDENGNLVEIPENIQKHIEAREEFWVDKIKDIDSKCGLVLERLALTEKALELACEKLKKLYCSDCGRLCDDRCVTEEDLKEECKLYYKCWNKECILEQAKEMK